MYWNTSPLLRRPWTTSSSRRPAAWPPRRRTAPRTPRRRSPAAAPASPTSPGPTAAASLAGVTAAANLGRPTSFFSKVGRPMSKRVYILEGFDNCATGLSYSQRSRQSRPRPWESCWLSLAEVGILAILFLRAVTLLKWRWRLQTYISHIQILLGTMLWLTKGGSSQQ